MELPVLEPLYPPLPRQPAGLLQAPQVQPQLVHQHQDVLHHLLRVGRPPVPGLVAGLVVIQGSLLDILLDKALGPVLLLAIQGALEAGPDAIQGGLKVDADGLRGALVGQGGVDEEDDDDTGHGRGDLGIGRVGRRRLIVKHVARLEEGLGREGRGEHGDVAEAGAGGPVHVQGPGFEDEDDAEEQEGAQAPGAGGELVEDDGREDQAENHSLHPPQVSLDCTTHKLGHHQGHGGGEDEVVGTEHDSPDKGRHEGNEPAQDEVPVVTVQIRVHAIQQGVHGPPGHLPFVRDANSTSEPLQGLDHLAQIVHEIILLQ
mmetsp:Transcript_16183/g.35849  ORF Transcript_16183/g.35849 Transcript_16183/m.35849 type:complete len:316 (-) Transcript_16183:1429-2376(-)